VRQTTDGRIHALELLSVLGKTTTIEQFDQLCTSHHLQPSYANFGAGREPTLTLADFVQLCFSLETLEAKRWRAKARELLRRFLEGDIGLAAEVAERSPSPEHRRWLIARLESTEARKRLMSTVAKHGGEGRIYQQLGSLSNQGVLKMNSFEVRQKRRVKNTRDGLTPAELLRLSYLEAATAKAIEERKAMGNDEILKLHQQHIQLERQLWEAEDDEPTAS
jgi:hypothetical protein